jgi:hypothetical protein
MEELTSGIAAMTKQGINAARATTQMNAMVTAFLKPSEAMTAALKEVGFESGDAFLQAEGLSGALKFLTEQSEGSSAKLATLTQNQRALKGVMALTGVGGEEFTRILDQMGNAAGSTQEAFDKQEKTFETLKASLGKVAIVTGNIGKHFVDRIAVGATEATERLLDFIMGSRGMEFVANITGMLAGAWEMLKTAIKPFVDTLGPMVTDLFETIGELFGEAFTQEELLAGASKVLAATFRSLAIGMTIVIKTVKLIIVAIRDLIIAIKESGGVIGSCFEFLSGKKKWREVKDQAGEAKRAFQDLGKGVAVNARELWDSTAAQVRGFKDGVVADADAMASAFQIKFESTANYVKNNWDEMITGQKDFTDQFVRTTEDGNDTIQEDTEETTEEIKKSWFDTFKEAETTAGDFYNAFMDMTQEAFDVIQGIWQQNFTNREAALENEHTLEIEALDKKLADGLITQEQYDAELAELNQEQLKERNVLAKEEFEQQKKFNIAQAWMNAASAIMGWWAAAPQLGPIAGPIFAGVMTGLTLAEAAVQTALINKQQFVPSRATGGMASGMTQVNEVGGEIITLPDGSQVIPNDISRQIAADSGNMNQVNINIYEPRVRKDEDINEITNRIVSKLGRELRLVRG